MERGAQASMEFFLVVALIFVILIPFIVYFVSESQSAVTQVNMAQISQIARKIAGNAESVYAYGEPTTKTLSVYMPEGVQAVYLNGSNIVIQVKSGSSITSISEKVSMNITGSVSSKSGTHKLRIQAANSSVIVSEVYS
ncbi:hypothetical protein HYX10_00125 [Candidatus Woesearchaeota archaeon]|nr:hypothetical protein [Candidatus Woesearchaeota archaeon]